MSFTIFLLPAIAIASLILMSRMHVEPPIEVSPAVKIEGRTNDNAPVSAQFDFMEDFDMFEYSGIGECETIENPMTGLPAC